MPKPLFSVSLGKPVIPRRNWKQWLCKIKQIMESKHGYYGQYENGKSLHVYRFQYGEESESPRYDIIPSDRCMFQSLGSFSNDDGDGNKNVKTEIGLLS